MTITDLATVRADAVARRDAARLARVDALLAGEIQAGDDVDLVDAAEAELARRSRAAALADYRANHDRLRAAIRAAEVSRLASIGEAEQAARAFVAAIRKAEAAGHSIVENAKALTGRTPFTVSPIELRNTYSNHLAGLLGTLPNTIARWGYIDMPSRRTDPNKSWVDVERDRNADVINKLLETSDE